MTGNQETLEKVAENFAIDKQNDKTSLYYTALESFIEGAKWQEQNFDKKYANEEVKNLIKIIKWYDEYSDVRPNVVISEDEQINGIAMWEWFEQFKKK